MIPRSSQIELEASPIGKRVVECVADVDRTCETRMAEQEQVFSLLRTAQVVTGTEVRHASAKQSIGCERIVTAAGSKLDRIDGAAANTPSRVHMQRIRQIDDCTVAGKPVTGSTAGGITLSEEATLFVVTD